MSQENAELFGQVYEAVNRRDLAALLALMDERVETIPLVVPSEKGHHGHAGIRRWWGNLFDAFPDYAGEVVEVRDLGDLTVAAVNIRGHRAESNRPLEAMIWVTARWRRRKIIWWRAFATQAQALQAAGLRE